MNSGPFVIFIVWPLAPGCYFYCYRCISYWFVFYKANAVPTLEKLKFPYKSIHYKAETEEARTAVKKVLLLVAFSNARRAGKCYRSCYRNTRPHDSTASAVAFAAGNA